MTQGIEQCTFDQIDDLLPITFDKAVVKLEHREFVLDCDVCCSESDAVKFWVNVYNMKSPMDEHKYKNLATIALKLLSIPTSDVDCERVFSRVRRIKTDFLSSLSTETISSLIGAISIKPTNAVSSLSLKTLYLLELNNVHIKENYLIIHRVGVFLYCILACTAKINIPF